jgi:hypothetical protein
MVKLEFYDPSGTIEVTQPHAPRLPSLEGKRIGIVTNEQWQAFRALPLLKSMFEQDFPGIEVLPIDAFPQGNARIRHEETAKLVRTAASTPSSSATRLEDPAPQHAAVQPLG